VEQKLLRNEVIENSNPHIPGTTVEFFVHGFVFFSFFFLFRIVQVENSLDVTFVLFVRFVNLAGTGDDEFDQCFK